jgi:L-seryl-tRNA(Ser) seleniumtransferase
VTTAIDCAKELQKLPKVYRLIRTADLQGMMRAYGREPVLTEVRTALEDQRKRILIGHPCPPDDEVLAAICRHVERRNRPTLYPVINASGVLVHTHLGRAPLSDDAIAAMVAVSRGYSNLEFVMETGERGTRYVHCAALLAKLSGAEDAVVVNNNAAAAMVALAAFARGREVILARSHMLEIGGGFRIPDILRQSGAQLVEVGTANRTYVKDYADAITERTAAIMIVHRSNFQLSGFIYEPEIEELAALTRERKLLLLDNVGSGTFLDTAAFGLAHEPTVYERIAAGADLVTFSGDKLLGGPQAGYVVGKKDLITTLKKFPLLRALRVHKITLAAIEATLRHYVRGDAATKIPVWRSMAAQPAELEARVQRWINGLAVEHRHLARIVDSASTVGGGSLPGLTLPSRALALRVRDVAVFAKRLRLGDPSVLGHVEHGAVVLDPRTVMPHEDDSIVVALNAALTAHDRRESENGHGG